jgi:hypothetical protein
MCIKYLRVCLCSLSLRVKKVETTILNRKEEEEEEEIYITSLIK